MGEGDVLCARIEGRPSKGWSRGIKRVREASGDLWSLPDYRMNLTLGLVPAYARRVKMLAELPDVGGLRIFIQEVVRVRYGMLQVVRASRDGFVRKWGSRAESHP